MIDEGSWDKTGISAPTNLKGCMITEVYIHTMDTSDHIGLVHRIAK